MQSNLSFSSLQASLVHAITDVMTSIITYIPQLLAGLLVFVLGSYISKWIKSLVLSLLSAINLTSMTKNTFIDAFLQKAEIRHKIEEILGEFLRWLVLYIFLIASVNIIGLTTVAEFLTGILGYLPQVISASLILAFGVIAAGFTESLVKSAIASFDSSTGRLVGKIASYTVVIFASLIAIGELGIAKNFINTLFTGFVAMLALGLGLAFGLGAKELVSQILSRWYKDLNSPSTKK
jgi:hypothetical protein